MYNLPWEMYKESRKIIIEVVLNTEFSRNFSLVSSLKQKLGVNLNVELLEDRIIVLSVTQQVSDFFKIARDNRTVFNKWMENMIEEMYKQGDMERTLELPISKFMDRENQVNKEKVYLNYINIVIAPYITTFMIFIQDET